MKFIRFAHRKSDYSNPPCACCAVYDHSLRPRYRYQDGRLAIWVERCRKGIVEWWVVSLTIRPH